MDGSYIQLDWMSLLISVSLVFLTGLVSWLLKLELLKSLVWGTVRAFLQLMLIGYALHFIFNSEQYLHINALFVVIPVLLLMTFIAAREASRRVGNAPRRPLDVAFLSLLASTFLVGLIVVAAVISPRPWYRPDVLIPIFGMILGNSMNGIALSLDRMYGEINGHLDQVEELLSMGATPWEAVQSSVQLAIRAGMMPTINSLMVVGLVSLPGMMTGQILAGMDPQNAVRYQFVVMIMVAAAVAIGCLLIVILSYKRMFNSEGALVERP